MATIINLIKAELHRQIKAFDITGTIPKYFSEGKYKSKNKGFEKSEPKNWTSEEKEALWDAVVNSKRGSFEEVSKIFESKGYSGLRPVHLSFVKR